MARRQLAKVVSCVLLVVISGVPGARAAQSDTDSVLEKARKSSKAPGAMATIVRCGTIAWSGVAGTTELNGGRPITTDTRFMAASVSKSIVATLVLRSVELGEIRLDETLDGSFPDLPNAGQITVRMLLDHSSGLQEYFDDEEVSRLIAEEPDHVWTRDEVIDAVSRSRFAPGSRYSYTNTNYIVLGGILEQVTGKTIEELFRERIVDPLGLSPLSSFRYDRSKSGEFAHPYEGKRDRFVQGIGMPSHYWGEVWTDGGLASTANELARIGDALFGGQLLGADTLDTMTDGAEDDRGLGVFVESVGDSSWLGHDGSYGGYEAEMWHDESRHLTLAVFSNADNSAAKIWRKLAKSKAVREMKDCGSDG